MDLYLDSAYVVNCYLNERDSVKVRNLIGSAGNLHSSAWCVAEMACTLQRHVREKRLTPKDALRVWDEFRRHVSAGGWILFPVSETLLWQVGQLLQAPRTNTLVRAGDAIHLVTARESGLSEIWTNDRHVLRAAPHFGLTGRSV